MLLLVELIHFVQSLNQSKQNGVVILGKLSRINPLDDFFLSGLLGVLIRHLTEAGNIPQLITKIPSLFDRSSKRISWPFGAMLIIPWRNPSAPYFSIRSSGSGELPRDLGIFRLGITDNSSEINIPERNTLFNLFVRQSGFGDRLDLL